MCLCAFLARVHPDVAGYDAFFANLAPFLDDFISYPEFGELLYLLSSSCDGSFVTDGVTMSS
jgi:hypothetical protein